MGWGRGLGCGGGVNLMAHITWTCSRNVSATINLSDRKYHHFFFLFPPNNINITIGEVEHFTLVFYKGNKSPTSTFYSFYSLKANICAT